MTFTGMKVNSALKTLGIRRVRKDVISRLRTTIFFREEVASISRALKKGVCIGTVLQQMSILGLMFVLGTPYLYSDNDTLLQDLGYHEAFESVDLVPEIGYTTFFVELIEGHIYAINTTDDNFAKIHVRQLDRESVVFDWGRIKLSRKTFKWHPLSSVLDKE